VKGLAEAWRLIEAGRYGEAEALLAQDPSPEARFVLGYALALQGRYEEALALYRALYRELGSHRALHHVGMVLRMAGRLKEALAVFEEEARFLPPDPLARSVNLYERGYTWLLLGEKGKAWPSSGRASPRPRPPKTPWPRPALTGAFWSGTSASARRRRPKGTRRRPSASS
jgi:tetratricopeptide (TPR) repeat protein